MEPEIPKDHTSVYYIVTELKENCEICLNLNCSGKMVLTSCNHNFCTNCLSDYYKSLKDSGEFRFDCPAEGCGKDIHETLKTVLDETGYSNFIKLNKRYKRLCDPNTIWCPVVDCEGYGIADSNRVIKCLKCDVEITETVNPSSKELLREHSLVECPACKALIIRTFGCMIGRCYCGTEFCLKCLKLESPAHKSWKCLGSHNDEISWLVIFTSLLSHFLVPILPLCLIFLYRHNWDRNYFKVINERPYFYAFFLFLFSPMVLVFSLFYLPFIWGWHCVDSLLNRRSGQLGSSWLLFKLFIYFPSVFLTFIIYLLVFSLAVLFGPFYGLALVGQKLFSGKK